MEDFTFTPASDYKDRHGLFIALVGGTNSGKSFSALRLATGIANAQGKRVAVLDTEGGRILHLRKHFDFDFRQLEPPHRPQRYLQAAQSAQAKGYGCMIIDSFSMEWRGPGGKLEWNEEELEKFVARRRAEAESKDWKFDETKTRLAGKAAASIEPSMAHKAMEFGFLQLRMPIIFAIRGALTYDPDKRDAVFKAQCRQDFLFDVTVSFRLAQDKKGIIDLSDAKAWKMEGDHAAIFKDGEQLSERHGELVNAWATNAPLPDKAVDMADHLIELAKATETEEGLLNCFDGETERKQMKWLNGKRPELYKKVNEAVATKLATFHAPEPRRSDQPAAEGKEAPAVGAAAIASPHLPSTASPTAAGSEPPPSTRIGAINLANGEPPSTPPEKRNWRVPDDVVGQEAFMEKIDILLAMTSSDAEQDELERVNAERIARVTGIRHSQLMARFRDKRLMRQQDGGDDGQTG